MSASRFACTAHGLIVVCRFYGTNYVYLIAEAKATAKARAAVNSSSQPLTTTIQTVQSMHSFP